MMIGTDIRGALVSTNSVTQGEAVANLWKPLFEKGLHFDFAYRTFRWDSEAHIKAHVHCVIIGFSVAVNNRKKRIFTGEKYQYVENINGYLMDAPDVFIESRSIPLCNVSKASFGSMANDKGLLSNYSENEVFEIIKQYPNSKKMFRPIVGSEEFLHNKIRYCLWLTDIEPFEIKAIPSIYKRVQKVKEIRKDSDRIATKKLANTPWLFGEIRQPKSNYLIIPRVSSERREYIPIGYMNQDTIASDANIIVPDASLLMFGVLASSIHNDWMRVVAGRLKSDYRYSVKNVYNNFPWLTPTKEQKSKIEHTARAILDARSFYPNSSLADMYDPDNEWMFPKLIKAHKENDKAVMDAYGFSYDMSESEIVAELMKMYQKLIAK